MEVAFSNLSHLSSKPRQNTHQCDTFRMTMWKAIGKGAAVLAFALYLPLSSTITTSCSSHQEKYYETMSNVALANAAKLRQAKERYTSELKRLAKRIPGADFQPHYGDNVALYYSRNVTVGRYPGIEEFLKKYGSPINEYDLRPESVDGAEVIRLPGASFDANLVAQAKQASQDEGLSYRLVLNKRFPELYFVFPGDVMLVLCGNRIGDMPPAEPAPKNEETFADKAKKVGHGAAVLGLAALIHDYGTFYAIPIILVGGMAVGTVAAVSEAASDAVRQAFRPATDEDILKISNIVLEGKSEMHDWRGDVIGYTDGVAYVASIETFRERRLWEFTLADEDFAVMGKRDGFDSQGLAVFKRTLNPVEADAIGFVSYEPPMYGNIHADPLEPFMHWYDIGVFNSIKKDLDRWGIGYVLSFQPMTNRLIFLTDVDNVSIAFGEIPTHNGSGIEFLIWDRERNPNGP